MKIALFLGSYGGILYSEGKISPLSPRVGSRGRKLAIARLLAVLFSPEPRLVSPAPPFPQLSPSSMEVVVPPLPTVRMAGAVMVTGHSFRLPSLARPFISVSVAPQHHYPPPSAHLPEQKRLARILGATFVSQFLNLHFYYRKI